MPRRGDTIDQANNDGFSRIDDGDTVSFWKSNPYLDPFFTGTEAGAPPQWVAIDFQKMQRIDAIRILWGNPFAKYVVVQYWVGSPDNDSLPIDGKWLNFPAGQVQQDGGDAAFRLSQRPISTRYVRLMLTKSSFLGPPQSKDIRDRLGFAIRELYVGTFDVQGHFYDLMKSAPNNREQTAIYVSSTDPWHRAVDLDLGTEQPGIDRLFTNGVTNGLPMLMPVGVLYDTPQNAAAMVRYIRARGYQLSHVEVGEEPDGQDVSPEHYAALYLQFASALHDIDPTLVLGGPSLQNGVAEVFPESDGDTNFMRRVVRYLTARGRLSEFGFLSFEHYPFDDLCRSAAQELLEEHQKLGDAFNSLGKAHLPTSMPVFLTEYGFSAFAGRSMVEVPSALLNADIVGQFLSHGGTTAFYYGSEPASPIDPLHECAGFGNMMLYEQDASGDARWPMPAFFGAQLLTQKWAQPVNAEHRIFPTTSNVVDRSGREMVSAYTVLRPDGMWAIMLINKDPANGYAVRVEFRGDGSTSVLRGPLAIDQYSTANYSWHPDGPNGYPTRSDPPQFFTQTAMPVILPPYSLTVVRGEAVAPGGLPLRLRNSLRSPGLDRTVSGLLQWSTASLEP